MKSKFHYLFLSLFVLLFTACSTTVITDEDRELPEDDTVVVEEVMDKEDEDEEDVEDAMEEESEDEDSDEDADDEEESEEEVDLMTYGADMDRSFIAFTGKKGELVSHEGKFNEFTFEIDKAGDEVSRISVTMDITSMETDSQGLTDHLQADDYFDAAQFPEATFESTSVEKGDGDTYTVTGTLTLHGVSNTETITATITDSYLLLSHTIDRTTYGVGPAPEGVKAIDAAVPIEAKITFEG